MRTLPGHDDAVRAKAALIDPVTMSVLWANELAEDGAPAVALEDAIPLAEPMGVPEAIRAVADTGSPRHLRGNLVSTARGDMAVATSIYRLPHGEVLVVSEHTWRPARRGHDGGAPSPEQRRRR